MSSSNDNDKSNISNVKQNSYNGPAAKSNTTETNCASTMSSGTRNQTYSTSSTASRDWPLAAAFQFLSRFPVPVEVNFTPEVLRRSVKYYPLVGLAIGAALCLAAAGSAWLLPTMPAAVLILAIWIWLTGGLHLDGWMDSADALLSYRSRERMLEIMKDSRVGAMGVIACILLLLLKMSLIYSLIGIGYAATGAALLMAPIWSRWFMSYAMKAWPTARENEGLANRFHGLKQHSLAFSTVAAVLSSALGLTIVGWVQQVPAFPMLFLVYFLAAPCIAWLVGILAAGRISKRLGGLTGDVYGALNEGLEAVLLLAAVICLR